MFRDNIVSFVRLIQFCDSEVILGWCFVVKSIK